MCYSQTVLTLQVLDQVEKHLQEHFNDSLENWITTSENFKRNPKFLSQLMNEHFENVRYRGIHSFENQKISNVNGSTSYFQMVPRDRKSLKANNFKAVPVGYLNVSESPWKFKTENSIKWRTLDNKPPLDRILTEKSSVPLVHNGIGYVLIAISILTIVFLGIFMIVAIKDKDNYLKYGYVLKLDLLFVSGLGLLAISASALPYNSLQASAPVQSMISCFFLVIGVCLILMSMVSKLEIGSYALEESIRQDRKRQVNKKPKRPPANQTDVSANWELMEPFLNKFLIITAIVTSLLLILVMVWFSIEPFEPYTVELGRHISPTNPSIIFMEEATTASFRNTDFSLGFLCTIALILLSLCLWTIKASVMTRKAASKLIADVQLVRVATYSVTILSALGAIVIGLLFSKRPNLIVAGSGVVILVVEISLT